MDEFGSKIIGVIIGAVVIFSLQALGVHKLLANIFGGISNITAEDIIKDTSESVNTNEYYYGKYPETSTRYLTLSDLKGKSVWNLMVMRNEIFARHGYIFKTPQIKQYFQQQTWYQPEYYDVDTYLTSIERANAKLIRKHEKMITSRYYGKYPEASTRYLTLSDLKGKSVWNLRIMRNEIFARHGYIFNTPKIKQYFQRQTWYQPEYYDVDTYLTSIERGNAKLIRVKKKGPGSI